jgi:small basic protein
MRKETGKKIISVFLIIIFMFNITGCATIPNNNDNNKTFTDDKKTEDKQLKIEKDKAEKNELSVGIGIVIPLIDNAYNELWEFSSKDYIKLWGINWLRGIIGKRLYFGYANAKEKLYYNDTDYHIKIYGLYKDCFELTDDPIYRFIEDVKTVFFCFEIIGGLRVEIGNIFDRKQFLEANLSLAVINMEKFIGKYLGGEMELGTYFSFLDPGIEINVISEIIKINEIKLFLTAGYGIRINPGALGKIIKVDTLKIEIGSYL